MIGFATRWKTSPRNAQRLLAATCRVSRWLQAAPRMASDRHTVTSIPSANNMPVKGNLEFGTNERKAKMKRLGKKCIIFLLLLVVVSVILWLLYRSGSEKAVRLQEEAAQAWSNVENYLEQRVELIPNLLGAVRGYVEFENELFENIAKSRQKYLKANSRAEKMEASNELGGFLSQLPDLQRKYRELRANESFVSLLTELEAAKKSIATARKAYNDSANRLNSYASRLFGKHFCRKAGVERMEVFQGAE